MNWNTKGLWLAAGAALLVIVGAWMWMNRGYAKISDSGYQYALALVSACNRQDLKRVQTIVQSVRQAKDDGGLSAYDARVLEEIGELAVAGNWEKAAANAKKLLKAQVSRAAAGLRTGAGLSPEFTSQGWGYAASSYPEPLFWQNSLTVEKPPNYIA